MLIEVVSAFLGVSLLLYCLLAGADFGAGILEIFLSKSERRGDKGIITSAMGPVWESNHMWLVLAVVILFNGFPRAYAAFSTLFHIPLTLILIGIVLRGCAFTFRHYDHVNDGPETFYSFIFRFSSLFTPLMLGTFAGASFLGRGSTNSDFYSVYVYPWCNVFCFSVGIFTCALFSFLAAVYLIGETGSPQGRVLFTSYARRANGFSVLAGVGVFICAEVDGFSLAEKFIHDPLSLLAMVLATLLLVPIWWGVEHRHALLTRLLAAAQVGFVLVGWFKLQFPVILASVHSEEVLTIYNSAAPEGTLRFLTYALIAGSVFIFPSLFYLFRIFK